MADTGNLYREIGALKAAASERTEYYARIIREQAKRIAELEVDNQRWREYNQQLYKANRKKHAALKKLGQVKRERGKALVDARQQSLAHYPQDFNSPRWEELAKMAREQLAREGKL